MLSPREFWSGFSKRQFALSGPSGLADALAYAALFDQLFGRLATHRVKAVSARGAEILCTGCDRARSPADDVCETHMGILQGQMGRQFGGSYEGARRTDRGECHLSFSPQPAGEGT